MSDRRTLLARLTKVLVAFGLAFLAVPFISYVFTVVDGSGRVSQEAELVVSVADLAPGQLKAVQWREWPVWVYRRTDTDLSALGRLREELRDPGSEVSDQPAAAQNWTRSLVPRYFVFIPRETSRNCQVRLLDPGELDTPAMDGALFIEPCYRAHFDPAGRIFRNSGNDRQRNLRVPPHRFTDSTTLALMPE